MNDHVVDRNAVDVVPLHRALPRIPDLDGAVLGAGYHPFPFTVESHARDIAGVPFKGQDGIGVVGLDVVELYRVVARGGEVALVRGDAEAVDLRVWVRYGAGADAGEGFPESGVV